jgi:hypothetical protein
MYLFGGKFCKFMDDTGQERECTCVEIVTKHPLCECDRKHFNNFLWATVTVFQVILLILFLNIFLSFLLKRGYFKCVVGFSLEGHFKYSLFLFMNIL